MTPSTPSGRQRLLDALHDNWTPHNGEPRHDSGDYDCACDGEQIADTIEREAVEAYRLALRAEIAAIRPPDRFVALDGTWEQGLSEASVLRLIEGEKP